MAPMRGTRVQLQEGEALLRGSSANLQATFIVPLGGRLHLTNKRLILEKQLHLRRDCA
jgi:hypothetical protein